MASVGRWCFEAEGRPLFFVKGASMSSYENATTFRRDRRAPVELAIGSIRRPIWNKHLRRPARLDVALILTSKLLRRVHDRLASSFEETGVAMKDLFTTLHSIKSGVTPDVWQQVKAQCLAHPVRELIHEDPFAHRCFTKPRGYAGDAVLIDFLYTRTCHIPSADPVTPRGQLIFDYTRDIPAGRAVRKRRDIMAGIIDDLCDAPGARPNILSVACGHLREAQLSHAVTNHHTGRFVALDQDELSLELVKQENGHSGITTFASSIKGLFRGPIAAEKFDLIYSTGLYDYLDERIATKLTHRMFEMLNPKGRVIIANFMPNLWCTAYMEALLDWNLIYRTTDEMQALSSTIPVAEVSRCSTFIEENKNIAFMEILKK
jgi:extracellular factor (EF) 3-hydroxypalmitic acid methyl ester biosynthesis protein